jgi:PPOX class probable FMN-dependent enzyme
MDDLGFGATIDTPEALRERYRPPTDGVRHKAFPHIDDHAASYIAASPFVLIGTHAADGTSDVTPRGGPPGFVQVLDERRLLIGDLPGNNRLDTIENILQTGRIGLLVLVPGIEETVRINGRACLTVEPEHLERATIEGRVPKAAIGVFTEEVYFHCAKAFRRSSLWKPEGWPATDGLASLGCIVVDQFKLEGITGEQIDADLEKGYEATMWDPWDGA